MATSPITFVRQVRTELAKVVWPTRAETIKLTLVVIGVSVGIGLFIGALDIMFVNLTGFLVNR